jgi:hypothetical protein
LIREKYEASVIACRDYQFPLFGCAKETPPTFVSTETLMTLVNNGKTCTSNDRGTECNYRVDDFFYVSIAAVGTSSAGIHFMKSDADKPIYASLGTSHGCVIVNRFKGVNGIPEFVFISPKNGVVYDSWDYCGAAL